VELQDPEIQFAMRRGVSSTNPRQLERERLSILTYSEDRHAYMIADMENSFGLSGNVYSVSAVSKAGADIRLNTLERRGSGTIFSSYFIEHSVRLSTDSPEFDHWIINGEKFETREVILSSRLAQNGVIRAELFLGQ
jgi:hypothetical protein